MESYVYKPKNHMKNIIYFPVVLLAMVFLIVYAWFPEERTDLKF